MDIVTLLAQSHLSVVTRHADYELARIQDLLAHKVLVDGRLELEETLGRLLAAAGPRPTPKTLDLIGHSTPGKSLLVLGDWVLDGTSPTVTAFFRGLADLDVLPRLGVTALRLIGCETAATSAARATITKLSDILGVEVYGTRTLIYSAHYDARGLASDSEHVLVGASELRSDGADAWTPPRAGQPSELRALDLDALPAVRLAPRSHPWPRRIATREDARAILRLVRRASGTRMPGLLAAANCELALPASDAQSYHLAQVLLDGQLLRFYPDGEQSPGVVYPVADAHELRAIIDRLSSACSGPVAAR